MLFNSFSFLVFFPIAVAGYFALPHRARVWWLLLASCYFYASFIPAYLLILFFLIGVDYAMGRTIGATSEPRKKKLFLLVSILANLGILFFFKYFNFFNTNVAHFAQLIHWHYPLVILKVALPLGLSFHVFQSLSYVIEVYRGRHPPETDLGVYALYVMFFPQLVAGPIERPYHLLPQLKASHEFDYARAVSGLRLMLWGFFEKVVVADRAALFADAVYKDPHQYSGLGLTLGAVFFSVQIYGDFAGYSNIAIGAARVLGIDLMKNFNLPYFSSSVAEFWRRWHISLSSWLRDYVYIPLGGNRVTRRRRYLNVLMTLLLSGLWHGAGWTFVIMGLLFGGYIVVGLATRGPRDALARCFLLDRLPDVRHVLRVAVTFGLVTFAWIFFRASNVSDALFVAGHLFSGFGNLWPNPGRKEFLMLNLLAGQQKNDVEVLIGASAFLFAAEFFNARYHVVHAITRRPVWVRWMLYSALCWSIIIFGVFTRRQFIYFQF